MTTTTTATAGAPSAAVRQRAEVAGYRSLWRAAPPDLASRYGIEARDLAGGICLAVAALPGSRMLNHAVGIGVDVPATEDDLDAMDAFYAALGVAHTVAVAQEAEGLRGRLEARGFTEDRPWVTFHRPAGPVAAPPGDLVVTEAGPRSAFAFGGVVTAGFGLPPELSGWLARLVGRAGWTCLVARDGDVPVGAAALFREGDAAWFTFGATLPEHRGRGAQGALFAARARRADAAGVAHFVTETGAPPPGQGPGPSHRNMLRAGFRAVAVRPNLASPGLLQEAVVEPRPCGPPVATGS